MILIFFLYKIVPLEQTYSACKNSMLLYTETILNITDLLKLRHCYGYLSDKLQLPASVLS